MFTLCRLDYRHPPQLKSSIHQSSGILIMQRSKSSSDTSIVSNTDDRVTQRKVIEAKKEEKKRLEDASCTFQPTMSARRGRENPDKPIAGSRFDYLYKDAVKRKSEGPKTKELSDENQNTFKPNISPRARSMSTDRTRSDVINCLHKGTSNVRSQVKEIPKDENLFTPKINKRADSAERSSSSVASSRLYASRTNQEENLQRKKGEVAAKEALECTFSPKLTRPRSMSRDSAPSPKPVIDRLLQYGADKKNKLAQDKQSKADKDKLTETFQPAIIRSKFSPSPKDNGISVHERLAQPLEKGKEFSALLAAADADLTFQPTLPKNRTSSIKMRAGSISGESIHERLFREAEQKRNDLEEEVRLK